jgi:hypothetical protein
LQGWHERGLIPVPIPGSNPQEPTRIVFYDSGFNPRAECSVAAEQGFMRRGALELPAPGLRTEHAGETSVIASRFP